MIGLSWEALVQFSSSNGQALRIGGHGRGQKLGLLLTAHCASVTSMVRKMLNLHVLLLHPRLQSPATSKEEQWQN